VNLAEFWWSAPANVALAYSGSWRDGLSAAAAMNLFGPVLWTSRPALSKEVTSYLLRERQPGRLHGATTATSPRAPG